MSEFVHPGIGFTAQWICCGTSRPAGTQWAFGPDLPWNLFFPGLRCDKITNMAHWWTLWLTYEALQLVCSHECLGGYVCLHDHNLYTGMPHTCGSWVCVRVCNCAHANLCMRERLNVNVCVYVSLPLYWHLWMRACDCMCLFIHAFIHLTVLCSEVCPAHLWFCSIHYNLAVYLCPARVIGR